MTYPPPPGGNGWPPQNGVPGGQATPYEVSAGFGQPVGGPTPPPPAAAPPYQPPQQHPGYGYQYPGAPTYGPPANAAPAQPGRRPGVVTAAASVMIGTAVLNVVGGSALMMLFIYITKSGSDDFSMAASIAAGVGMLVVGLGCLALALGVLRGRFGAWVTAIVVSSVLALATMAVRLPIGMLTLFFYGPIIVLLIVPPSRQWFAAMRRDRA